MTAIAEILGEWVQELAGERIPARTRRKLHQLLIDTGGLMVSARNEGYVLAVRDTATPGGNCTAIGHERGFSPGDAALISGVAIHGEDFDDTFEGTPVHVGSFLVPALLAAGEHFKLSGNDLLRGLAAGGELACRMAVVAPTAMHKAAFHPTAVIGALATAFGVAAARRLPPGQIASALGIAGSMASGIIEYLAEGTSTKRLHPGWAAQSGLRAAALAENGFTGPGSVLEGKHGFFAAFAHADVPRDFRRLTGRLGQFWEVERLAFKPYACGTMAQPFIDAAADLRSQVEELTDIAEIVAPTSCDIVHRLWEPAVEKAAPSTPYSAKFSIPYCIAIGLIDGSAGLEQFTKARLSDPAVRALAAKVRYEVDPEDPYPDNYVGAITVRMRDGTAFSARQSCLRGGFRAPMEDAELIRKFRANAAFGGWPAEKADRYLALCDTMFDAQTIDLTEFRA